MSSVLACVTILVTCYHLWAGRTLIPSVVVPLSLTPSPLLLSFSIPALPSLCHEKGHPSVLHTSSPQAPGTLALPWIQSLPPKDGGQSRGALRHQLLCICSLCGVNCSHSHWPLKVCPSAESSCSESPICLAATLRARGLGRAGQGGSGGPGAVKWWPWGCS